jgi:hypothetical protein
LVGFISSNLSGHFVLRRIVRLLSHQLRSLRQVQGLTTSTTWLTSSAAPILTDTYDSILREFLAVILLM